MRIPAASDSMDSFRMLGRLLGLGAGGVEAHVGALTAWLPDHLVAGMSIGWTITGAHGAVHLRHDQRVCGAGRILDIPRRVRDLLTAL